MITIKRSQITYVLVGFMVITGIVIYLLSEKKGIQQSTNSITAVSGTISASNQNNTNGNVAGIFSHSDSAITFTYPTYLQPKENVRNRLESADETTVIRSIQIDGIGADFVDINGGEARYLDGVSIEFPGTFEQKGDLVKKSYGHLQAYERVFFYHSNSEKAGIFTNQYRQVLLYNEIADQYLLIGIHGFNTESFIAETDEIFTSARPTGVDTAVVYTDETRNPFSGETYFIKKWASESTFCGVNGSGVCDLVIKKGERYRKVANLFFRKTPKTPGALQGAKLLSFDDAETLLINFGSYDHGGGYSTVHSYNLKTQELIEKISFGISEISDNNFDGVAFYQIRKGQKSISFVNNPDHLYSRIGIYTTVNDSINALLTDIIPPYKVEFDVTNNYRGEVIDLTVNAKEYQFDFGSLRFR